MWLRILDSSNIQMYLAEESGCAWLGYQQSHQFQLAAHVAAIYPVYEFSPQKLYLVRKAKKKENHAPIPQRRGQGGGKVEGNSLVLQPESPLMLLYFQ